MTASPSAFLEFVRHHGSSLSPDEQAALLAFVDGLDPSISTDSLTSQLSRFLLDHEPIDARFSEKDSARGIGGQPIKLTPAAFKTNLRNIVLQAQPTHQKDGGTPPKH
jgi:hypothetical protein